MITEILDAAFLFFTSIIAIYLIRHYIFTLTVIRLSKNKKTSTTTETQFEPSVSILIPAHNEESVIDKLLQKMSEIAYPKNKLEILLIDDGSTDNTGLLADQWPKKCNFIKVLHRSLKEGGKGKAAALNAALKQSKGEIILCFDADYLPHNDIVARLVEKFVDPKVGAVQGRPVVLNEPKNLITRLIAMERIGGYRVDQEAREALGLIPQFGGTVGGFRKSIIEKIGGFDEAMLTEDTDLTMHIYRLGYKIRYAKNAECYEEAVETWRAYWRQRHRWAKGHMQVCFKHAFKILTSKNIKTREKIDGLLLLHIYFMPLLTLLSFVIGSLLILTGGSTIAGILWFVIPLSFYSFVGNYAPFFEVGVGAHLDGRHRSQWLVPLLTISFMYNVLICWKAFFELMINKMFGNKKYKWEKTEHFGTTNHEAEQKGVERK